MNHARLQVFTGKGGVGKTAFSLAYAKALQQQGRKVLYNHFDQTGGDQLCQQLGLEELKLSVASSAVTYIEKKLGSALIAKWIFQTPFFNALFDMLPGLGHMILFGHLVEMVENDPELTIIIDSPSSGHAVTMFEAASNFREIFQAGLIVKDIDRMQNFLKQENSLKTVVICLPTFMALQEGKELQEKLHSLNVTQCDLWLNDSFLKNSELESKRNLLPPFLIQKLENEEKVLNEYQNLISQVFPRFPTTDLIGTIKALVVEMERTL